MKYYKLDFDTSENNPHTFTYNDVLRVQRWTGRSIKYGEFIVVDEAKTTVDSVNLGTIDTVTTDYVLVEA